VCLHVFVQKRPNVGAKETYCVCVCLHVFVRALVRVYV
jgi:hypothetical protein